MEGRNALIWPWVVNDPSESPINMPACRGTWWVMSLQVVMEGEAGLVTVHVRGVLEGTVGSLSIAIRVMLRVDALAGSAFDPASVTMRLRAVQSAGTWSIVAGAVAAALTPLGAAMYAVSGVEVAGRLTAADQT